MSAPAAVRRAEPVCRRHLDKEARALVMGRASLAHDEFGPDRLPPSLIFETSEASDFECPKQTASSGHAVDAHQRRQGGFVFDNRNPGIILR
jgi:hypothetical protein